MIRSIGIMIFTKMIFNRYFAAINEEFTNLILNVQWHISHWRKNYYQKKEK